MARTGSIPRTDGADPPRLDAPGFAAAAPSSPDWRGWRGLLGGVAAVERNVGARQVARGIRGQEYDDPFQVVLAGHASQKGPGAVAFHERGMLPGEEAAGA